MEAYFHLGRVGAAAEDGGPVEEAWLRSAEAEHARGRLVLADGDGDLPAPVAAAAQEDPFGLTPRERQVLVLVAEGRTNREIGDSLFMAEKTASVHVSRILAKLDVRSRTEAAAVAHRLGLDGDVAVSRPG
jgi:DNA-binding NarL/FixJ family response regulator